MFPLRDTHKSSSVPIVNFIIIGVNILIFLLQFGSLNPEVFIRYFGFIPLRFSIADPTTYTQALTSMFLHGGIIHIVSNMWFLHIFGDNVEDRMGHIKYALFYIFTGLAAVFAQYAIDPTSSVPIVGASGAIAGVTGAYFIMFKKTQIVALMPSFVGLFYTVKLPATFFLGYWFVLQVISGFGSLGTIQAQSGGVAFFAHIGGFVAGAVLARTFYKPQQRRADWLN